MNEFTILEFTILGAMFLIGYLSRWIVERLGYDSDEWEQKFK